MKAPMMLLLKDFCSGEHCKDASICPICMVSIFDDVASERIMFGVTLNGFVNMPCNCMVSIFDDSCSVPF